MRPKNNLLQTRGLRFFFALTISLPCTTWAQSADTPGSSPQPRSVSSVRGSTSPTPTTVVPNSQGHLNAPAVGTTVSHSNPISGLEASQQAHQQQSRGVSFGIAMTGFAASMAIANCLPPPSRPKCPYWVAGIGLAVMVTSTMNKSKNKSQQAINDRITTGYNTAGSSDFADTTDPFDNDLSEFPESERSRIRESLSTYNKAVIELTRAGYTLDQQRQLIRTPQGKEIKLKDLNSPESMQAAGFSEAEISDFIGITGQMESQAAQKIGAVDSANTALAEINSYSDEPAGSGKSTAAADSEANFGGLQFGSPGGEVRIPATAKGFELQGKSINLSDGTPIGVRGASIFGALNERYLREQPKLMTPSK